MRPTPSSKSFFFFFSKVLSLQNAEAEPGNPSRRSGPGAVLGQLCYVLPLFTQALAPRWKRKGCESSRSLGGGGGVSPKAPACRLEHSRAGHEVLQLMVSVGPAGEQRLPQV